MYGTLDVLDALAHLVNDTMDPLHPQRPVISVERVNARNAAVMVRGEGGLNRIYTLTVTAIEDR